MLADRHAGQLDHAAPPLGHRVPAVRGRAVLQGLIRSLALFLLLSLSRTKANHYQPQKKGNRLPRIDNFPPSCVFFCFFFFTSVNPCYLLINIASAVCRAAGWVCLATTRGTRACRQISTGFTCSTSVPRPKVPFVEGQARVIGG